MHKTGHLAVLYIVDSWLWYMYTYTLYVSIIKGSIEFNVSINNGFIGFILHVHV